MKHLFRSLVFLTIVMLSAGCGRDAQHGGPPGAAGAPPYRLTLPGIKSKEAIQSDSLGVMFCVDVSPSMNDSVGGQRKIEVSKVAMKQVLNQIETWSKDKANAKKPLRVGLIAFSGRADVVRPLEPFNKAALERAVDNLQIGSATAIGDAMILASQELMRAGVENKAIIVLTDGENNRGVRPDYVMRALRNNHNNLDTPTDDVKVFLLAFDIQAAKFNEVKEAGAVVLESKDKAALEKIMSQTVEEVLLEKPR